MYTTSPQALEELTDLPLSCMSSDSGADNESKHHRLIQSQTQDLIGGLNKLGSPH